MEISRKTKDLILESITYLASLLSVLILGAILIFIFVNGSKGLSFKFVFGKYEETNYLLNSEVEVLSDEFSNPKNFANFSSKYGVAFSDSINNYKEKVVEIIYIDKDSPIKEMLDYNGNLITLKEGFHFETYLSYLDVNNKLNYLYASSGANQTALELDNAIKIESFYLTSGGGGILGSILTTILLVFLTLLIGFPVGIVTALYLHQIAPKNRLTNVFRVLIDMLTGVPSIIYGLIGASLLIPFSQRLLNNPNALGGNILAGSLTLSIMVLPVVIKATESALDVVPPSYKEASLALGANEIQTTFKVVLPNALPGILSAALLTIGRVIGESAALIYVIGTVITDNISVGGKGTSLAVHIWSVMAGENPNIEVATSIAIIILVIVLVLNLTIKFITKKLDQKLRGWKDGKYYIWY